MRAVHWTARANASIGAIFDYLAERNAEAAHGVTSQIVSAGDALGVHATGRPARIPGTFIKSLPDLSYVLTYRIDRGPGDERIVILDVIHSRRSRAARL